MLRMNTAPLLLISVLALSALGQQTPTPTAKPTEQAQVVATVERMYLAATNDDLAMFHTVAAPGFFAYDVGRRFDGDALMQAIKALHASGKQYVWRVTEPAVQLYGDTALITFVNRGSVQDESGKKDLSWLESALLRKEQGAWRIKFFHSTRVPPQP